MLDIVYCRECCQIGKAASEEFLGINASVIDAVFDFQNFTENCFKMCPYKAAHIKNKDKES